MDNILSKRAQGLQLSPLQLFFRKAKEMKEKGINIISLAVGELNFPTPENIRQSGIKAIEADQTRYTPAGGMTELRGKATEDFQKSGIPASINNTIVSSGSQPLIAAAILAVTNPGDTLLVPSPYYPSYIALAQLFDVETALVDTRQDDFQLKTDAIKKVLSDRAQVLVFNSPNNPTGAIWDPRELLELPADICFIVDEAYQRVVYENQYVSVASLPELADRAITIRSCSKSFNMSGWRVGYLTGPEAVVAKIEIILEAIIVSASSISQAAAITAFANTEKINGNLAELQRRRDVLVRWLNKHSMVFPNPQGAFYAFANLPERMGLGSTALAEMLLEKAGVVVTPGIAFGNDGYIRMSYASVTFLEQLQEGLERIEKTLGL